MSILMSRTLFCANTTKLTTKWHSEGTPVHGRNIDLEIKSYLYLLQGMVT